MRRRDVLRAFLALPALLAGCGDDEDAVRVDLSRREEPTLRVPPRAVTYAYLPQYAHTVSYERHRLLLEYLGRATGLSLRQIFPDTFEEHVRMVERGEIDISYSNPFAYIRMARSGARAFARIIEPSGKPDFRSQIICRRDNPELKTIDDCRGKRWMAVDPSSAGGYLYALGEFLDHGIHRRDFAEVSFAPGPGGKQEKVVLAVFAGTCDVGSIRDGALDILRGKIDIGQIRVLAESKAYPGWVYAARAGLAPDVVERIARAMFALSMARPDDAVLLQTAGMRGIIPATDADYAPVRELAEKLDLVAAEDAE
ncbi:phosphate/phosphite/phosphonate ABC transporter substrate-binding protein [Solidesulfovibrio sp.]|jgi:phosphonate transport system substrate-binding protein|uniref:phosphate/phosphite/phosphonate ABC transporter substrate-binding protein n=1 Tax=Solidesulfovibrio sp. TaxID=2910990 RepID=UPI002B21BE1E|nr:phosphate/phosphite/phosphonate ABC transporter substrate-binding protein [Solidesulfovibrio sp.]MEA5088741.1 phosphate/phosphite/phosphonate ABC transporter substrate-binding protein [Solidesulfovibrio sp.]HML62610.1 phosphate/phosphite/phosphonate ABC transporter substrate-binding protein [Solidesulfovibrio sp.]